MQASSFLRKRVLVLGLGLHGGGVSVVRWLVKQGARVTVSDVKSRKELAPSLNLLRKLKFNYVLGKHPLSLLSGCDLIVQNPGVPRELPLLRAARQQGIAIENEASLFLKLAPARFIVGISGSKGKSTTTAMLGAMLKRQNACSVVAGNIRDTVMFDVLSAVMPKTPVVLELSSWHLEIIGKHKLRVPVAVLTNVLPEHLNRYRSMADYARAKANLFRYQTKHDAVVMNYDNALSRRMARRATGQVYWFSLKHEVPQGAFVRQGQVWWRTGKVTSQLFSVSDVSVLGEHNLANAMAAATAAKLLSISNTNIRIALRSFKGLHDRLELVREWHGVRYINDTTATAPAGTLAALAALRDLPLVLIAGGTDKSLSYQELGKTIARQCSAVVLLPGSATGKLQNALPGFRSQFLAKNMQAAVGLAARLSPRGGVVLLSPAAASFGLFQHEFDRGEQFVRAVKALR